MPGRPRQKAFQRFQAERAVGPPTFPHYVGGTPSYVRTFSGWVYVAFVTDVPLAADRGVADHLPASVHRPGPGRPSDGRLATKMSRC